MVDSRRSPPGYPGGGISSSCDGQSYDQDGYVPGPLTAEHREELCRRNKEALYTPILGETPEARALEATRLANVAECARLENLQRSLDDRARRLIPESSQWLH